MCRTCRVLHYMTLPKLHEHVSLRSYPGVRYVDGSPEGAGAASPFSMALNGLVTRNVAPLVRHFRLHGGWREHELQEHARMGRVPDASMMLNIVVRAAIDRMTKLESFTWQLDTKLLETAYQGLAARATLQSLTIRFPSSRLPRPSCTIPPIPSLRSLTVTHMDPLCHPDDISRLLLGSKRLAHLTMHWSPRMRDALEPSVNLQSYFGMCMAAGYVVPLESVALYNLYAINPLAFDLLFDRNRIRSLTALNTVGGANSDTSFADVSWERHTPRDLPNLKFVRVDKLSRWKAEFLDRTAGLEQLYIVSAPVFAAPAGIASPGTALLSPQSGNSPAEAALPPSLSKLYIDVIAKNHGATLRHLLLSAQWALTQEELARLVRGCPNLEQVGFSLEKSGLDLLYLLLPFLKKIHAIRMLDNPASDRSALLADVNAALDNPEFVANSSCDGWEDDNMSLKFVGITDDLVVEVGPLVPLDVDQAPDSSATPDPTAPRPRPEQRFTRGLKRIPREAVQHLEIWAMDSAELRDST